MITLTNRDDPLIQGLIKDIPLKAKQVKIQKEGQKRSCKKVEKRAFVEARCQFSGNGFFPTENGRENFEFTYSCCIALNSKS